MAVFLIHSSQTKLQSKSEPRRCQPYVKTTYGNRQQGFLWSCVAIQSGIGHVLMVPSPFLVNGPSLVVSLSLSVLFLWLSTHQSLQRKDVARSVSSKPQFWVCSLADIWSPPYLSHVTSVEKDVGQCREYEYVSLETNSVESWSVVTVST